MSVGYQSGDAASRATDDWSAMKEDVDEAAGVAAERGKQFINSAVSQATDYVDRRKSDAAQSVEDVANSLREATRSFEDRPNIKAIVDSAAESLDGFADSIRSRTFADMYADFEEVARRRPTTMAVVSTVAGFMIARFLKSSAQDIHERNMRRSYAEGRSSAGGDRPSSSSTQPQRQGSSTTTRQAGSATGSAAPSPSTSPTGA